MLEVGVYDFIISEIELLLFHSVPSVRFEILRPSRRVKMNSSSFLFANSIYLANMVVSYLLNVCGGSDDSVLFSVQSASSKILLRSLNMI